MKKGLGRLLLIAGLFLGVMGGARLYAEDAPGTDKYYEANALYNKKLYKLAIDEYRNFLAKYPSNIPLIRLPQLSICATPILPIC